MEGIISFFMGVINDLLGSLGNHIAKIVETIVLSPEDLFKDQWGVFINMGKTVILPFANIIFCFGLATEIVHQNEKLPEGVELSTIGISMMKYALPYFMLTKTYDVLAIIFNLFNLLIQKISTSNALQFTFSMSPLHSEGEWKPDGFGETLGMAMQLFPVQFVLTIMGAIITVIVYGRIFEIVLYWIIAPIPFATLVHSEFSQVGKNFIKMFAAVMLQGVLMLLCVAIFAFLVKSRFNTGEMWDLIAYACILILALVKSGTMAKRICGTF